MGLGFTAALSLISAVRELLGAGSLWGVQLLPSAYEPMLVLILAPGGFIVLGLLIAVIQMIRNKNAKKDGAA